MSFGGGPGVGGATSPGIGTATSGPVAGGKESRQAKDQQRRIQRAVKSDLDAVFQELLRRRRFTLARSAGRRGSLGGGEDAPIGRATLGG